MLQPNNIEVLSFDSSTMYLFRCRYQKSTTAISSGKLLIFKRTVIVVSLQRKCHRSNFYLIWSSFMCLMICSCPNKLCTSSCNPNATTPEGSWAFGNSFPIRKRWRVSCIWRTCPWAPCSARKHLPHNVLLLSQAVHVRGECMLGDGCVA